MGDIARLLGHELNRREDLSDVSCLTCAKTLAKTHASISKSFTEKATIMDKSSWDSHSVTSILCVSQVMSQKAVLSFYKSMSPPPSPPNVERSKELCLGGFQHCPWGGRRV